MPRRVAYLDNLKVILVAGVVFGHGWAGYDQLGSWAYSDVREVSLRPVTETALEIALGPFGLFAMGFFLLISGMLTPQSLARKGSGRFIRDRAVRLGVPLVVFAYLAWPPVMWLLDRAAGRPYRFDAANPDPVHLWFVEVLLLFSVGYALWRRLPRGPEELRTVHLLGLAAAVAVGSFLVRLRFPLDSTQFLDLHLWQWPQYLALFGLGLVGKRPGWLDPVPDRLMRGCALAALFGTLAIAVLRRAERGGRGDGGGRGTAGRHGFGVATGFGAAPSRPAVGSGVAGAVGVPGLPRAGSRARRARAAAAPGRGTGGGQGPCRERARGARLFLARPAGRRRSSRCAGVRVAHPRGMTR